MNVRLFIIFSIVIALIAPSLLSEALAVISETRKQELIRMANNGEDLDKLAPEEKELALKHLLEEKAKRPDNLTWSDTQLLQLAHEPTIQRYAERMKAGFIGFYQIGPSRQPRLIEFCENLLMKKEPPVPSGRGDILTMSQSVCAALLMMELTRDAVEMPAGTRAWAQTLAALIISEAEMAPTPRGRRIAEEARLIVRNWFAENKAVLQSREFSKVRPGAEHSLTKATRLSPSQPATNVLAQRTPPPVAQHPKPASPVAETTPPKEQIWPMILMAALAALLALGLILGRRRGKN